MKSKPEKKKVFRLKIAKSFKKNTQSVKRPAKSSLKSSAAKSPRASAPLRSARITHALKKAATAGPSAVKKPEKILTPFHTDEEKKPQPVLKTDLPYSYGSTEIVLLIRDPYWAYAYWDFSPETWSWLAVTRERDVQARAKLRIHNRDRKTFYDLDVNLDAKNWYVDLGLPNTSFEVELGLVDSQGCFHLIAKSNGVRTPRNGPSENTDPNWPLSDAEFAEVYRLSGSGKNTAPGSEIFSARRLSS